MDRCGVSEFDGLEKSNLIYFFVEEIEMETNAETERRGTDASRSLFAPRSDSSFVTTAHFADVSLENA